MTVQEAEKLIDDLDKAFKAGLLKATLITLIGAVLLFFLTPIIENLYADLRYWWDWKKFDREREKKLKNSELDVTSKADSIIVLISFSKQF